MAVNNQRKKVRWKEIRREKKSNAECFSPVQLSPRWSATIAMRKSVRSQGLWGPGKIEDNDSSIPFTFSSPYTLM